MIWITALIVWLGLCGAQSYRCFSCNYVSSSENCKTFVECSSSERCYAERIYENSTEEEHYNFGCLSVDICQQTFDDLIVGKKRKLESKETEVERHTREAPCRRCCSSDDCNKDLCQTSDSSDNSIRLIDGNSPYEGTVEIFYNNRWGTVCDDVWTTREASVACYINGAVPVKMNGFQSNLKQDFWLDDVTCLGNETSLFDCGHRAVGTDDCGSGELAGVKCIPESYDRFIRLVDGNSIYEGTVEVFYNNIWGTVCDDFWSTTHAQIVCKMLGHKSEGAIAVTDNGFSSLTSAHTFWLDDVHCIGNEASIFDCSHQLWGHGNCGSSEIAGVKCKPENSQICNFENGMCGYTQVQRTDSIDWIRWTNKTGSIGTGPSRDHTTQNGYGYYMFINSSSRVRGDKAQLLSPEITVTNIQSHCIYFWYHMYGADIGTLNVYARTQFHGDVLIWTKSGELGDHWYEGRATINGTLGTFRVIFEGVVGKGYRGNIGLDDLRLADGVCPHIGSCDFEYDMCGLFNMYGNDTFDWQRSSGETSLTGPPGDHTTNSARGFYMFTNASQQSPGGRAWMSTNFLPPTNESCLTFWYYMDGIDLGSLRLYLFKSNISIIIWVRSGNQGDQWNSAQLDLSCPVEYQIVFVGERGRGKTSEIAIDDLIVKDGACDDKMTSLPPLTTNIVTSTVNAYDNYGQYIRLVDGNNTNEGTVEVFHNGRWGAVCDDFWSTAHAEIVCQMLGYQRKGSVAVTNNGFQTSLIQDYWLDNVTCTGNETSLFDCKHTGWGEDDCDPEQLAGVRCGAAVTQKDIFLLILDTQMRSLNKLNLATQSYTDVPLDSHYIPGCFDYDPTQDRIYFYDQHYRQIISISSDGNNLRLISQLEFNSEVRTIKLDPQNELMFYSDDGLDVISSIGIDGRHPTYVASSNINSPRGIALDPLNRKMYWTDWGIRPQIESADYDGTNRRTLAYTNLKSPDSITIDFNELRLYFVDGGKGTIESMDFYGNNRIVILQDSSTHFFSLDLLADVIYFTSLDLRTPMRVHKDGSNVISVGPESFSQLAEIKVIKTISNYSERISTEMFVRLNGNGDATKGRVEFFVNGHWGTVCNNLWDDKDAQVVCHMLGFDRYRARKDPNMVQNNSLVSLNSVTCSGVETHIDDCSFSPFKYDMVPCPHSYDVGVFCESDIDTDYQMDDFLVFCNGSTGELIRMDLNSYSYTRLHLPDLVNCSSVVFHPFDQHFYFSVVNKDHHNSKIYSLNQRENSIKLISTYQEKIITWLAIDVRRNILFVIDSKNREISKLSVSVAIRESVANISELPNSIAVDGLSGEIFWTSNGASSEIGKTSYVSSHLKHILATSGLKTPTGVAVDPIAKLLYFCDAGTHTIEVMNTDGSNRKVLFTDYSSQFSGLVITSKYIFYTDLNKRNILRLDREGSNHTTIGPPDFLHLINIYAYDSSFH